MITTNDNHRVKDGDRVQTCGGVTGTFYRGTWDADDNPDAAAYIVMDHGGKLAIYDWDWPNLTITNEA